MKVKFAAITSLPVGAVLIFLLFACRDSPSLQKVTAQEFVDQAQQIEQIHSAHWVSYIGISHERAYLEYGTAVTSSGEARTTVLWTELDKLPPDLAAKLRAGNPPWVPWKENAGGPEDNTP